MSDFWILDGEVANLYGTDAHGNVESRGRSVTAAEYYDASQALALRECGPSWNAGFAAGMAVGIPAWSMGGTWP